MALKIILTTEEREALDPVLQAEYVPLNGQEGRFVIDGTPADGWAVEDVAGLRRTVETTRNERDTLKGKLKTYDGVDVTEHQRLLAKKDEIDGWDPTSDEAFTTRLAEANATWQTKYDTDTKAANDGAEAAQNRYVTFRKQSEAVAAISQHAPTGVTVLLPHVLGQLDVFPSEDGATDHVWVRGSDGRPRITQKAGEQGNMSAEELVLSMKEQKEFAPNYPGTGATGSGATGGGSGSGTPQVDPKLNAVERLKAFRRTQSA